jgi:Tol biopolymer transport system component
VAYEYSTGHIIDARVNVMVHDRSTGATSLVSSTVRGDVPDRTSGSPAMSGDGRFVAFHSNAYDLVAGDTNDRQDVFLRDLSTGTTVRVSVASDRTQANSSSLSPGLSSDGGVVVFSSSASNLVPGDTNGVVDAFAHTRPPS